MKCNYCGYSIKENFLTVDDVIKAGHFHQIKCPRCKQWFNVYDVMGESKEQVKDRDANNI